MKRMLWAIAAILVLSVPAHSQDVPSWELFGGYSYMRSNLSGPGSSFTMNGATGALEQNFNSWLGGRLDVKAFTGTTDGTNVTAQTITYGPVFAYRKIDKFTPYAHVTFGDVHASTGYLGISTSANKFAMTGGGGLDFNVTERAAVRVQADYLMTRFLGARQDNLQFSAGLVIRLGKVSHPTW
jgi:opacity protein-like surface antigen